MLSLLLIITLLQPQFQWADQTTTQHGTASFVKTADGRVVALTSAHFINFSGPRLLSIEWLNAKTQKLIATSTRSWGMPGKEGCYAPLDLRSDYLLAVLDQDIPTQSALELDERVMPEVGERVWFPQKTGETIAGTVIESRCEYLKVKLDKETELTARSGTPILSESTGKIIGIFTGSGECRILYLAPAFSIRKALIEVKETPRLSQVIGE